MEQFHNIDRSDRKIYITFAPLATQFFQDYQHRSALTLSAEETSSSSQVSIPIINQINPQHMHHSLLRELKNHSTIFNKKLLSHFKCYNLCFTSLKKHSLVVYLMRLSLANSGLAWQSDLLDVRVVPLPASPEMLKLNHHHQQRPSTPSWPDWSELQWPWCNCHSQALHLHADLCSGCIDFAGYVDCDGVYGVKRTAFASPSSSSSLL